MFVARGGGGVWGGGGLDFVTPFSSDRDRIQMLHSGVDAFAS